MVWRPEVPDWVTSYQMSWLTRDIAAGAATWAVLVPIALSIAAIAGVYPVVGLYTLPLALVGYVIFGGQRVLVMGPDAAVAILSGSIVASIALNGEEFLALTVILALTVGVLFVLFYILRLGWTADLIPDPVLKGFTEGIIWLTIIKQSAALLGFETEEQPSGAGQLVVYLLNAIPNTHLATALVAALSIATLVVVRVYAPRLPGPLIVLVGSIVLGSLLGFGDMGVAVLGAVEAGEWSNPFLVDLDMSRLSALVSGGLAIVVLSFTKAQPALKRAAEYSGQKLDPNRELLALGASNIGAGLGGGYALSASLTATSINVASGAKTQFGNLFASVLCFLTILFLLPFLSNLALSSLAAIIVVALGGISDLGAFRRLWRVSRYEFAIALAAFVGVLGFGVLPGVVIGVVLAFFKLAYAIHAPVTAIVGRLPTGGYVDVDEHPDATEIPGMLILHQYGPLVFLNSRIVAAELGSAVAAHRDIQVVVLDATTISGIDSSAAVKLIAVRDELAASGIELWVVNPRRSGWQIVEALLTVKGAPVPMVFDTIEGAVFAFETSDHTKLNTEAPADGGAVTGTRE
jgi:SulP family sulfate permease